MNIKIMKIISIAAAALLTGCAFADIKSKTATGVYTGEAIGHGGTILVEVETSYGYIRSIQVVSHSETDKISDPAFSAIPAAILSSQSLNVDLVAGCTQTSRGLILAVQSALAKSGSDLKVSLAGWEQDTPAMAHTVNYSADVVIIGAGGAGLSAAVEALRAGASVILLEKLPTPGGNTLTGALSMPHPSANSKYDMRITQGEKSYIAELLAATVDNSIAAQWQADLRREYQLYEESKEADYLFDSLSLFKLQCLAMSGYKADPELIDTYAAHLTDSVRYLEGLGVRWNQGIYSTVGSGWRRCLIPKSDWGSAGATFVMAQLEEVQKLGGQVLCGMQVEELLVTEGRITGVRGSTGALSFEVSALKGVILATGGFSADNQIRESSTQYPFELSNLPTRGTSSLTGDGLRLAASVGAQIAGESLLRLYPFESDGMVARSVDNIIILNSKGDRFVREDAEQSSLSAAIMSAGGWAWAIFDSKSVGLTRTDRLVDRGVLLRAESSEILAEQINIPADKLEESLVLFNRAVTDGGDLLGRAVFCDTLSYPPFYATRVSVAVSGSRSGVKVNKSAQVLDVENRPLAGLWAAGEVTGALAGLPGADSLVFGRIAGRAAATQG